MAENVESRSWWSSWIEVAKEKSISAYNVTKRDLAEFMTTVQKDTSNAVNEAANTVRYYIQSTDDNDTENNETTKETKVATETIDGGQTSVTSSLMSSSTYDRNQTELEILRNDPATYCTIPEGQSSEYVSWTENFDLSKQQEEISKLLISSSSIRKLQSDLVPAKVSYESFWHHYFYRIHLLGKTETKRAELMARACSQGQLIRWDDDEDEENAVTAEGGQQKFLTSDKMTDSSESFVCINEDGSDAKDVNLGVADKESPPPSNGSPPPSIEVKDSDSDWEKWDD